MNRVSLSLPEDLDKELDDLVEDGEYESKSAAVRELIRECQRLRTEYDERVTAYEQQIEDLERKVERLENEKRMILEQREENTELVRYVQEERTLERRRAEAGVLTRAKWWLTGMPTNGERVDE